MSILAVGSPMRPHTLTQTDQNTVKSYLQTGRAIRSFIARDQTRNTAGMAKNGTFLPFTILPLNGSLRPRLCKNASEVDCVGDGSWGRGA